MKPSQIRFDLLKIEPLRSILRRSWFPVIFQVGAFLAIFLLVINGLGLGPGFDPKDLMTIRKTNLTTLVVWGLWWPGMIAVALVFGRAWCTVCPLELVNRLGDSVSRKLNLPRARLGKILRAGWMIVVIYLVMQILVTGVSLHRVPHFTAILLLVLLGGALASGLVFRQPRSFCRAFCPAGALLSVYGRYTPFQLETRNPETCEECATKDCIQNENRYRFDHRSCPSLLRPFDRKASDGCVLCLQCAKVCPHENIGIGVVSPTATARKRSLLKPYEAAFVMVALGFVTHELVGEVKWLDSIFHFFPERLAKLAQTIPFNWFEAGWFLVVFPLFIWSLIASSAYIAGHRKGLSLLLLAAATGAAPVVAIAHLAKAVAKISSWSGYLPLSLSNPDGISAFKRLADGSLAKPTALLELSIIGLTMLILTFVIGWKSVRWAKEAPPESRIAAWTGLAGAMVVFTAVLTVWAWPTT